VKGVVSDRKYARFLQKLYVIVLTWSRDVFGKIR
jgi:hypothetical protein